MIKLGLALGGGGARGLAHIGVLKVLEQEQIKISSITGCSMGAIIGGLYAYYGNAGQVEDFIFQIIESKRFKKLTNDKLGEADRKISKNYFEQLFEKMEVRLATMQSFGRLSYFNEKNTTEMFKTFPDVPIEDLQINFSAIATDLLSGDEINFTRGSLKSAIRASSAIPGFFAPVTIGDYLLVDGSASESVPVGEVKEIGADRVLAVDVSHCIKAARNMDNIISILYRTETITSFHLSKLRLKEADIVVHPQVRNLQWTDFDKAADIIYKGELAAREMINEIKNMLSGNRIKSVNRD